MPITQEDIERFIGRQTLEYLELSKRLKEAENLISELKESKEKNDPCEKS